MEDVASAGELLFDRFSITICGRACAAAVTSCSISGGISASSFSTTFAIFFVSISAAIRCSTPCSCVRNSRSSDSRSQELASIRSKVGISRA